MGNRRSNTAISQVLGEAVHKAPLISYGEDKMKLKFTFRKSFYETNSLGISNPWNDPLFDKTPNFTNFSNK